MNNRIIAIEGVDGSGKNTQSRLLVDKLRALGHEVEFMGFPCYGETFMGKEIGAYLNGEFGGLNEVHPKLASLLYAGDRLEKKPVIEQAIRAGKVLVIDRYVSSNIAHQGAKLGDEQRAALTDWLTALEYDVYGLPKPTLTILLNMDVTHSTDLVLKKAARVYTDKKQDIHESDMDYMGKVAGVYYQLSQAPDWYRVECIHQGMLRSVDDIATQIVDKVLTVI